MSLMLVYGNKSIMGVPIISVDLLAKPPPKMYVSTMSLPETTNKYKL